MKLYEPCFSFSSTEFILHLVSVLKLHKFHMFYDFLDLGRMSLQMCDSCSI